MKTVSIKPCINREYKIKSSQFGYIVIGISMTMNFLAVVTPPYIYHNPKMPKYRMSKI